MKCLLSVFLLVALAASSFGQILTTNLVLRYKITTGQTIDGATNIVQLDDSHLLLNNDGLGPHHAPQTVAGLRAAFVIDAQGHPGALFGFASPQVGIHYRAPDTLIGLDTRNLTTYVVASRWIYDQTQSLIGLNPGTPRQWLRFGGFGAQYVTQQTTGTRSSNGQFSPPNNKVIYVSVGRTTGTVIRYNNTSYTTTAPSSFTGLVGAVIGSLEGTSEFWNGILYDVLIYKAQHTDGEIDQMVTALASEDDVRLTYANQAALWGDSLMRGFPNATFLRSLPFQLLEKHPNWKIYEIGTGGIKLSTMDSLGSATIDFLYDPAMTRNLLGTTAGTNDIGGSSPVDGDATFTRLQTLLTNRLAIHPWETAVGTLPDRATRDTEVGQYNFKVRLGDPLINHIMDFGKNSPIETRLSSSINFTIFDTDELHLINKGYEIEEEYLSRVLEKPAVVTGKPLGIGSL